MHRMYLCYYRLFGISANLKLKHHPWVLFFLSCILFQTQGFLIAAGLGLGYMVTYSQLDSYFNFSGERTRDCEESYALSWIKRIPGYITVESAQIYTYEIEGQMKPADIIAGRNNMLLTPSTDKDSYSDTALKESRSANKEQSESEYVTVIFKYYA